MRRRKRFSKKTRPNEDMYLQITSMADIFTILLVFLLKSFSVGVSNVSSSSNLELPVGRPTDQAAETLKVEISSTAILVDDKPATTLRDFRFDPADVESDGTPRSLNTALIRERLKKHDAAIAVTADPKVANDEDVRLTVLADQKTPYATVKTVMDSAANSGFSGFKLVVVEEQ